MPRKYQPTSILFLMDTFTVTNIFLYAYKYSRDDDVTGSDSLDRDYKDRFS